MKYISKNEIRVNKGTRILNFSFWVLCLKNLIPIIDPIPPPSKEKSSKEFSGIRQRFLFAFSLSTPYNENAIKLMIIRYIIKNFI